MTDEEEYERRKGLTFLQAEGLAPLPHQLKRGEISEKFKTRLLNLLLHYINDFNYEIYGGSFTHKNVIEVFENEWVNKQERFAAKLLTGEENTDRETIYNNVKRIIVAA